MQRILLTFLLLGTTVATMAQIQAPRAMSAKTQTARSVTERYGAGDSDASAQTHPGSQGAPIGFSQRDFVGIQIGTTTYDLQTNSGMGRRVALDANGGVHAMWTMGENITTAPGRGTGYNYSSDGGTTWGAFPVEGAAGRIEDVRTGWPSIGITTSGRLFSLSHTASSGMHFCYKNAGEDFWQNTSVGLDYNDSKGVWARAATSGNTIHAVVSRVHSTTESNLFPPEDGVPGGLAYSKSTDGGDTWSDPIVLPGLADHFFQVFADDYSIDARGDVVAVVVATSFGSTVLFKSTDAGANWTSTVIWEQRDCNLIDVLTYDLEVKASLGGGGATSVVIDSNNKIHVVSDRQIHGRSATFDPGSSYASGFGQGIVYWNEDFGADPSGDASDDVVRLIPKTLLMDMNSDMKADMVNYEVIDPTTGLPSGVETRSYGTVIGQVSMGIDASNNLYAAYSGVVDADYQTAAGNVDSLRYHRDIFLIKSTDGGATWTGPFNITSGNGKSEDAFPSIARDVNGFVHVVYQADPLTGTALQNGAGQGHAAATVNQIMYVKVPVADIVNPTVNNTIPYTANFASSFLVGVPPNCAPDAGFHFNAFAVDYPDGDLPITVGATFDMTTLGSEGNWILSVTDANANAVSDTIFLSDNGVVTVTEDLDAPLIIILPYDVCEPYCTALDWAMGAGEENCLFTFPEIALQVGDPFVVEGAEVIDIYTMFGCPVAVDIDNPVNTGGNGTFSVTYTATDPSGNISTDSTVVIIGTGIAVNSVENNMFVHVSPNPSNGVYQVNLGDYVGEVGLNVYSVAGNLLARTNQNYTGVMTLDISKQAAGLYILEVITSKGVVTQKIAISK